MLSFSEKRSLQRIVQDKLTELESGSLSFKQKRQIQLSLEAALSKLLGDSIAQSQTRLDELIAGKFNHLLPKEFLQILEEIVVEIGGDIEPIKPPTVNYIKANQNAIMESALQYKGN